MTQPFVIFNSVSLGDLFNFCKPWFLSCKVLIIIVSTRKVAMHLM